MNHPKGAPFHSSLERDPNPRPEAQTNPARSNVSHTEGRRHPHGGEDGLQPTVKPESCGCDVWGLELVAGASGLVKKFGLVDLV